MEKIKVQLSNDSIDKHGERMSLEALEQARDATNTKVMSSYHGHDYSKPPIARFSHAYIEKVGDINVLFGECERFEVKDVNKPNPISGQELAIHDFQDGSIQVVYDRSYEVNDLVKDVEELQAHFDDSCKPGFELKKSVEPVSTLTICIGAGVFVAGTFITGFISKAGQDSWDALKNLIQKNSLNSPEQEKIYQFTYTFRNEFYKTELLLIFSNPNPGTIKNIIEENDVEISSLINKYYEDEVRVGRIAFIVKNSKLRHSYSVYKDGTPFDISDMTEYEGILNAKGGGI